MTVLVTGGAGFIGSHLCDSLLADGREVICLDNFSSGRQVNIQDTVESDKFRLVIDDVKSELSEETSEIDGSIEEIYHLASRASPVDFREHASDIAWTSAKGTYNVLEFARKHDARVLLVSTSEVYGDPQVHPQSEEYNGNVNIHGERACYDEGKRFAETLATTFISEYGIDVRTVRPFNTYGPRMRSDDGRVIPTFIKQALQGDDLTIYGDGSQTRSFLYVSDQIRGMRRLMEQDNLDGTVLNVGSQREITIKQFGNIILDLFGTDSNIVYRPLPEDDPQRRKPDISRATELLNWTPEIPLEKGLERTYDHFKQVELSQNS